MEPDLILQQHEEDLRDSVEVPDSPPEDDEASAEDDGFVGPEWEDAIPIRPVPCEAFEVEQTPIVEQCEAHDIDPLTYEDQVAPLVATNTEALQGARDADGIDGQDPVDETEAHDQLIFQEDGLGDQVEQNQRVSAEDESLIDALEFPKRKRGRPKRPRQEIPSTHDMATRYGAKKKSRLVSSTPAKARKALGSDTPTTALRRSARVSALNHTKT
jgi:hypothetical protein